MTRHNDCEYYLPKTELTGEDQINLYKQMLDAVDNLLRFNGHKKHCIEREIMRLGEKRDGRI